MVCGKKSVCWVGCGASGVHILPLFLLHTGVQGCLKAHAHEAFAAFADCIGVRCGGLARSGGGMGAILFSLGAGRPAGKHGCSWLTLYVHLSVYRAPVTGANLPASPCGPGFVCVHVPLWRLLHSLQMHVMREGSPCDMSAIVCVVGCDCACLLCYATELQGTVIRSTGRFNLQQSHHNLWECRMAWDSSHSFSNATRTPKQGHNSCPGIPNQTCRNSSTTWSQTCRQCS